MNHQCGNFFVKRLRFLSFQKLPLGFFLGFCSTHGFFHCPFPNGDIVLAIQRRLLVVIINTVTTSPSMVMPQVLNRRLLHQLVFVSFPAEFKGHCGCMRESTALCLGRVWKLFPQLCCQPFRHGKIFMPTQTLRPQKAQVF